MTCRRCWSVLAIFIIIVIAISMNFFIKGTTTASSDERTAIVLNIAERAYVLKEMRGLLEAIEAVTLGISQDEMKAVSLASREVGMGATRSGNEPMTLIAKLPLEFKTLGMSVHRSFDELALEADTMGDGSIILGKLGAILNTCTTCHANYKFTD